MFDIEDYNYELPQSSIAQVPTSKRDHSRLCVVDRNKGSFSDSHFFDLPELLKADDLIVVNDTRVVPARLFGQKESGGRVEILVLEYPDPAEEDPETRACLLKSSKRPKIGNRLFFGSDISGQVKEILDNGLVRISFGGERSIDSLLEEQGIMPLPPYIKRDPDGDYARLDKERYQTVFSKRKGAVAAPTAGLHFTDDLINNLKRAGISVVSLTLHVGYGTFQPVRTSDIRDHELGEESYRIEPETAEAISQTRKKGGRVVAVGTTVVRTLESAVNSDGSVRPGEGRTGLLITPGFSFNIVDALITNFHLPKSSLLFLVSAFAGLELVKKAYGSAVEKGYRFYSYGDAMLLV
jgi:S-adenosylmethionine:tRNA ribosyltransferase-isomerase